MKYKNLRDFIAFLEEKGELRRVTTPVTWDLEITEICDRVTKSGGPALLFENVEGYDVPVLINMYGSERRMSWALGSESLEELGDRVRGLLGLAQGPPKGVMEKVRALGQLMKVASVRPKIVRSAPCQEVVLEGDEVDVTKFPILKCWPEDAGRYITLPLVITKDPESGVRNVGTYRMQVFDKRTCGMHWQTQKVGTAHYRASREQGRERLDVAVALGGDPATIWSGTAPLPPNVDEMMAAGFIRGEAVEMVQAKTVDLEVPAQAEIILEGYVTPGDERTEGPFGDHTGYYSLGGHVPGISHNVHHASSGADLSDDDCRKAADGGLLHGEGDGAVLPADYSAGAAGSGGHEHAGGGGVPQPGDCVGEERLSGAGAEGCLWAVGDGVDGRWRRRSSW